MSELITEIISQDAFDQVKKMDKYMSDLLTRFEGNVEAVKKYNAALSGSQKISDMAAALKKSNGRK